MYKMFSILLISLLVMLGTVEVNSQKTETISNMSYPLKTMENVKIGTIIETVYVNETDPELILIGNITKLVEVKNNPTCNNPGTCNNFDLVTKSEIDRDDPLVNNFITWMYKFSSTGTSYFNYLEIGDENDNEPIFQNQPYKTTISEIFPLNDVIPLNIIATDIDENPTLKYSLAPAGQNSKGIEDFMAIKNIYSGDITVIKTFDYEERNFFEYTVSVTDGKYITNASVWIQISDIQDMPPAFTSSNFVKNIEENSAKGFIVTKVKAVDQDRGVPHDIGYSITYDSCSAFAISNSGEVTVNYVLDRENETLVALNGVCTIEIKAYEKVGNTEGDSTMKNITIFVEDMNDNDPLFNKKSYNATVSENATEDDPVTVSEAITVKDCDTVEYSKFRLSLKTFDNTAFTILKISPAESVTKTNLALSVNTSIELDCEAKEFLEFKIVATDIGSNHTSEANVTLKILSMNEFYPTFNLTSYNVSVSEKHKDDYLITVQATDLDCGEYGKVTYALFGEKIFTINTTSGRISVSKLDYEKINFYNLNVEATDGGNKKAIARLEVFVLDFNDESPVFKQKFYTGRLNEEETKFQYKLIVEATDADKPNTNNSEVKYSIQNATQGLLNSFSIDGQSGEITPSSRIDFENLTEHIIQLVIKATDNGKPALEGFAHVNITVFDVNDNTPKFQESLYNISVKENATADSFLFNITAKDEDKTIPLNQVTYRLKNYTSIFRINSASGNIFVSSKLNREDKSSYELTIEAIDGGSPPKTSTTTVIVTVEDVNDEVPKLNIINNDIKLYENMTIGSFITSIKATDEDLDNKLIFNISLETIEIDGQGREINKKTTMSYFDIDPDTGNITLKEKLDREKFERISLSVEVSDQNTVEGRKTAKGYLKIIILDINDCYPAFSENVTSLKLVENYPIKRVITTLTATDDDKDDAVTYKIVNSSKTFTINNKTGEISLSSSLDREEEPNITFYVVASDSLFPTLSSTATVSVVVKDFNDNAPEFQNVNSLLTVPENTAINSSITTIKATDKDEGMHASINYQLKVPGGNSPFEINTITGEITLTSELDRETVDKYTIVITARDNYNRNSSFLESGWKENTTTIVINVTDFNDNPPEFKPNYYHKNVDEDKKVAGDILTVTTIDRDIGKNKKVLYALQGNDSVFFNITKDTGKLSVKLNLTNEIGSKCFNVIATDQGIKKLSSTAKICIDVIDINNNKPIFGDQNATVSIAESTCANTVIYTVNATDADYGVNEKIVYKLKTTTDSRNFEIDQSGDVKLKKQLDYETKQKYKVEIIASDSGVPQLSATFVLLVNVQNDNDEPPVFENPNQSTNVTVEEGPSPIFISNVKAKHSEFKLCYTIDNIDDASYFIIKNDSGQAKIEAKNEIDFETKKFLKLVVVVQNCISVQFNTTCPKSSSPNLNNRRTVEVFIKDINDNPPIFKQKELNEAVIFDISTDVPIIDLSYYVTDADTDLKNIQHEYFIESFKYSGIVAPKLLKTPFEFKKSSIYRKADFDSSVSGYIEMSIKVNDTKGFNDTTSLKIHIISEKDKLRVVFNKPIEDVRTEKDNFIRFLQTVFGDENKVISGRIDVHKNDNGDIDGSRTDMLVFAVNNKTKHVLPAHKLMQLLDVQRALNQGKFLEFGVENVKETNPLDQVDSDEKFVIIFIAVIVLLALILIVIILLFCASVRRYNRKLRAAETNAKSPSDVPDDVGYPGANQFSEGQSNPIYINSDEFVTVGPLPEKSSLNAALYNEVDDIYSKNATGEQDYYSKFHYGALNSFPADNSRSNLDNVIKERDAEENMRNNYSVIPNDVPLIENADIDIETTDV